MLPGNSAADSGLLFQRLSAPCRVQLVTLDGFESWARMTVIYTGGALKDFIELLFECASLLVMRTIVNMRRTQLQHIQPFLCFDSLSFSKATGITQYRPCGRASRAGGWMEVGWRVGGWVEELQWGEPTPR